jgi:Rrf2 family nitric oxide-sensitive transcriptional repressor
VNLKTQTDYALRTLLYLAFVDEKVTAERIAEAYKISKDHLVKVIQQLARLGYVRSQSGRTGGVRLAKPADKINVADVISDFEGRGGVLACVSDPTVCNLEPGCLLRVQLIKAERAFYETLRPFTIADLIKPARGAGTGAPGGGVYNLSVRPRGAGRTVDSADGQTSGST